MSKKLYEEASVQAIADAIRDKCNTTDTMTIAEMPDKITSMSGGGELSRALIDNIYLPSGWKDGSVTDVQFICNIPTNCVMYACNSSDGSYDDTARTSFIKCQNYSTGTVVYNKTTSTYITAGRSFASFTVPSAGTHIFSLQDQGYNQAGITIHGNIAAYLPGSVSIDEGGGTDGFYPAASSCFRVVCIGSGLSKSKLNEILTYNDSVCVIILPCEDTVPSMYSYTLSKTSDRVSTRIFFVKDTMLNNFKNGTNWCDIADHIFPLSQCPYFEN